MDNRKKANKNRLWFDCAQLVIGLCIPLTIIVYTVMYNNTELSIARENRLQDLKIADERHKQDIMLSNDEQEEATLVHYFDSLGKLLEKENQLTNKANIARFKTLTALAQLKPQRKGFLIRSLIESNLIVRNGSKDSILDLSLADLTGLNLAHNMIVNNEIRCVVLSQTKLTNASFRGMKLDGSTFIQTLLVNSDFSSSSSEEWPCGDGHKLGLNFKDAILDDSIFNDAKHQKTSFSGSSLDRARMRHFSCSKCTFLNAKMNSMDLSGAEFSSDFKSKSSFQKINMSFTCLYKAKFTFINFAQSTLTRINATETIFNNSTFSFTFFENVSFIGSIIYNSSFEQASFKGSLWHRAKINYTSFIKADMGYVSFINSHCHYCVFNQTQLTGTNFTNSSLDGSDFREASVTYEQLIVARSLRNVILPNGTIFQSMKKKYI